MRHPVLHPGWPARLAYGPVELTALRRGDAAEWSRVRLANEDWLAPWGPAAAPPRRPRHPPARGRLRRPRGAYRAMRGAVARGARLGASLPFAIRVDGRLAGQVTVDNVV